jgi:DNA-binding transcriptional ArsR family regulator
VDTNADAVLAALADPTRRAVLEQVALGPVAVGEIAGRLPVSRPAVSQHLRVLTDAGLVSVRAAGTRRLYSLRGEGLLVLRDWLDGMWRDALTAFAAAIDEPDEPDESDEEQA